MAAIPARVDELISFILHTSNSDAESASAVAGFTGDINSSSCIGLTVLTAAVLLHHAAKRKNGMVKVLLENFPTMVLNRSDIWGNTALHIAAYRGNDVDAGLLLDYGVDTTVKNHEGYTAEEYARKNGFHVVADLISRYAARNAYCVCWMKACVMLQ